MPWAPGIAPFHAIVSQDLDVRPPMLAEGFVIGGCREQEGHGGKGEEVSFHGWELVVVGAAHVVTAFPAYQLAPRLIEAGIAGGTI